MKITRIAVHQVALPLEKPYRLSGGRLLFAELDSTIVGVETDAGIDGWGEGCPWGATYLPAFGRGVRAGLEQIAPRLLGLKLGRVGGLTKARRMRDFCMATGLRMNIEDTGGSIIADTAAVQLAQSTPASHRRATWLCQDMIGVECAQGGARNEGGVTRAPEAPGLGLSPRAEILGNAIGVYQ